MGPVFCRHTQCDWQADWHRQGQRARGLAFKRVYGLTDSSAATAALSNSASRLGLAPLKPATTSRAHRTYSSRRLTSKWGGGLAVLALILLAL